MAEKTGNEIWDDMKNAQEALVDENLKKYKAEKDNLAAQAEANASAESTGASADHQNYATPNGVGIQADAVSRLGLNKGKLSETNLAGGYNAYQSRLAAAARQAQNAKDRLELGYNMYGAQSQAEKSNAQANYNAMKNSEYWKKANWDYQLAADKKAEEEAKRAMNTYYSPINPIDPGKTPNETGGGVTETSTYNDDYGTGLTGLWRKQMLRQTFELSADAPAAQPGTEVYEDMMEEFNAYLKQYEKQYKGNKSKEATQYANYLYATFKQHYGGYASNVLDDFGTKLYNIQYGG